MLIRSLHKQPRNRKRLIQTSFLEGKQQHFACYAFDQTWSRFNVQSDDMSEISCQLFLDHQNQICCFLGDSTTNAHFHYTTRRHIPCGLSRYRFGMICSAFDHNCSFVHAPLNDKSEATYPDIISGKWEKKDLSLVSVWPNSLILSPKQMTDRRLSIRFSFLYSENQICRVVCNRPNALIVSFRNQATDRRMSFQLISGNEHLSPVLRSTENA